MSRKLDGTVLYISSAAFGITLPNMFLYTYVWTELSIYILTNQSILYGKNKDSRLKNLDYLLLKNPEHKRNITPNKNILL